VTPPGASAPDYKTLVQDDRIHASLYTDPRIFADELERIFHRGWVFVGHDSEIPDAGAFVTRTIGTEPVILVCGKDGGVAVLVNRCMHRGTQLCMAARGQARAFTCPYHGWSYDLGGELLGALISNVEPRAGEGGELVAESNFLLAELAVQAQHELHWWAGRTTHRLRRVDGELRMCGKMVVLVNAAEPLPNLGFLI
jgi:phenylpropionate dioxygenase-like ring-hydroxylating dioxygenase large terminal subunit